MDQTIKTPNNSFEIISQSYVYEAERMGLIAESGIFKKLIARFEDYNGHLATVSSKKRKHKLVHSLSKGGVILDISKGSNSFEELLSCAHIASCCDLFSGSTFPLASLGRDPLKHYVSNFFNQYRNADTHTINPYFDKLNSADAIRTIQTLKLLGLVNTDTHTMHQLSFGVGNATKDLYSIHQTPIIQCSGNIPLASQLGGATLQFSVQANKPKDVILVDNHPEAGTYFEKLNQSWDGKVTGYSKDAYEVLQELPSRINNGDIAPRNLIVSLRFDHLMLPDVNQFFFYLGKVIDHEADLIMSIGAGHTDEEFEGRLKTISQIYTYLREKQLSPLRIKLYRGSTTKEKREQPGLGAPQYATYEIIYCRLKKNRFT